MSEELSNCFACPSAVVFRMYVLVLCLALPYYCCGVILDNVVLAVVYSFRTTFKRFVLC